MLPLLHVHHTLVFKTPLWGPLRLRDSCLQRSDKFDLLVLKSAPRSHTRAPEPLHIHTPLRRISLGC